MRLGVASAEGVLVVDLSCHPQWPWKNHAFDRANEENALSFARIAIVMEMENQRV
jgi:hypothetical protein